MNIQKVAQGGHGTPFELIYELLILQTPGKLVVPENKIVRQGTEAEDYLFDLYDQMIGDLEIPSVLQKVAEVVRQDLNAERATVYLIDQSTRQLESAAILGNVARIIRVPICESSLAGFCALTGRAFVVADAYQDLSYIDPKLASIARGIR